MGISKQIFFFILLLCVSLNAQEDSDNFLSKYDSIVNHTVQKKRDPFWYFKKIWIDNK